MSELVTGESNELYVVRMFRFEIWNVVSVTTFEAEHS